MANEVSKSTRWQFTAYEAQFGLFISMPPGVAEWGWQQEMCPTTNRVHYQGYLRLNSQQRFSWLKRLLPGVHLEIARNWDALVQYCKKDQTRVAAPVHQVNDIPTPYSLATSIASDIVATRKWYEDYGMRIPRWVDYKVWRTEEAMSQIEARVNERIASGQRGVEWIASNPNWSAMWKKYWCATLVRQEQTDRQTAETAPQITPPTIDAPKDEAPSPSQPQTAEE